MLVVLLTLLLISGAMAARDFLGTVLVVAEARGRDHLAGLMDALGDVAQTVCMVLGVDSITLGLTSNNLLLLERPRTWLVLTVQMVTSYNVTRFSTKWSRKLKEAPSDTRSS